MTARAAPLVGLLCAACLPAQFVRPTGPQDAKLWGVEGGIVVGVHPDFRGPLGGVGPRGLLRVGLLRDGAPQLVNFIAVEPLAGGRRGLSELERSAADRRPGKRFSLADDRAAAPRDEAVRGVLHETAAGRTLSFLVHVERFANGAEPIVEVTLFEEQPLRVRLRTFAAEGSAPIEQLTLSATMGNLVRARNLWLAGEAVHAGELYRGYRGDGFVEHGAFPLERLHRTEDGAVVVAITPDELDPGEAWPFAGGGWRSPIGWVAQYWRKPPGTFDESLACRVNGRRVYWMSRNPLPCGVAYENFELRETFAPGQEIWFGFDADSPAQAFGFGYDLPPGRPETREVPAAEAALVAAARRGLTNGDFGAELDGWLAEPDPTPFRLFEERGSRRLTTFGAGHDADRGRLSQCFRVPQDAAYLRFFVHGGCDRRLLRVNLWHGEELVRWITGRDHNDPIEVRFSLAGVRGEVVTLEIVDRSTAPWGFLGVHGFEVVGE